MIGISPAIRKVFDLVERVAATDASVLIQGESGTGKEMVALAIHERSQRAAKPMIAINCSAIPENLLESELFGHSKGAFTGATRNRQGLFAEADGGTVFLDEIGDMPISVQPKLLRVLQDKKIKPIGKNEHSDVDVRIIAATHRVLRNEIQCGRFRKDLFYRLSVIPIHLPPLRERREDIPLLAGHFLRRVSRAIGKEGMGFTPSAIARLMELPWEGNVRELQNVVERAAILSSPDLISEEDLLLPSFSGGEGEGLVREILSLREMENQYIKQVLDKTGGRKGRAAEILGIDRKTLYRKVSDWKDSPLK